MSTADAIRAFVIRHYITPARAAGDEEVGIRLGDIRSKMQLTNPLQSVRTALGSKLFQEMAGVEILEPIDPPCWRGVVLPLPDLSNKVTT